MSFDEFCDKLDLTYPKMDSFEGKWSKGRVSLGCVGQKLIPAFVEFDGI